MRTLTPRRQVRDPRDAVEDSSSHETQGEDHPTNHQGGSWYIIGHRGIPNFINLGRQSGMLYCWAYCTSFSVLDLKRMGFKSCSGPTWIYDSKLKIRLEKQNWENPLGGGKPFIFKASIYKASLVVLFLQSQRPETTTNKSPGGWRSRNHVGLKMGDTWYQDLCQFNRQITANPCVYNCEPTHGNCGRAGPGMDQNSGPTPIVSCFNSGCEMQ